MPTKLVPRINFHAERQITPNPLRNPAGADCPVKAGMQHGRAHHGFLAKALNKTLRAVKLLDKAVRRQVAKELGHGRIEITNAYLG